MTSQLVTAARKYIGTKWRHRGRSVHGVDCAGLGILAYRDCGVELPDFTLYGREPHNDGLVTYMTAALGDPLWIAGGVPGDRQHLLWLLKDGDVIVQRFEREPHHVAIVAEVMYGDKAAFNVVHADGQAGRVLEVRLDAPSIERITHIYRRAV